jgi:hypothetical protein
VYVSDLEASVDQPVKELAGFAKVFLKPGESTTVDIPLHWTAFQFFDPASREWTFEEGTFRISAAQSAADIQQQTEIVLDGENQKSGNVVKRTFSPIGTMAADGPLFEQEFFGPNGTPLWPAGDPGFAIIHNEGAFTGGASQTSNVAGVDLSSAEISDGFKMSVDFRLVNNVFFGLWFMGGNDGSEGTGLAQDGYVIRLRAGDGLIQGLNFDVGTQSLGTGGWSTAPSMGGLTLDGSVVYRLEMVASPGSDGTTGVFDVTLTDTNTSTVVANRQLTRDNAFTNPETGGYFGLFATGSAVRFSNFSVTVPRR